MAIGPVGGGPVGLTQEEEFAYGMLENAMLQEVLSQVDETNTLIEEE